MKKIMLTCAVLTAFCGVNLFAMASDCPNADKPCVKKGLKSPKANHRKINKDKEHREHKNLKKFPKRPKLTPEQQAEMKAFFETVKEYKTNPTEENKAKVMELLNKGFDKHIEMSEKRVADLKKKIEEIEKRNAELKANREAEIQKHFDKIMSFKKPEKNKYPH